jgi:protein-tyrosine phosphatase
MARLAAGLPIAYLEAMKRVTRLEGVHNFRHWHGYTGHDGAVIRDGLYRSGHFSRSSPADQTFFDDLGIQVVADLRRPGERRREPSPWTDSASLRVIQSDQDDHAVPPHVQFLREADISAETVRTYMLSAYRRMPMEAGNQAVFREGFKALASGEADSGFLVHCAAGKDRTGIFCALVLRELGVPEDVILDDYLLTNRAVDFDVLVPKVQGWMKLQHELELGDTEMRAFLGVDADYLAEALRVMHAEGDYLTGVLGLDEVDREALRARWLKR